MGFSLAFEVYRSVGVLSESELDVLKDIRVVLLASVGKKMVDKKPVSVDK